MEPLIHTAGRMHPMVLHLPIGLLLGLAAWEVFRALARRQFPSLGAPAVFLAWMAVMGSAGAIATGLAHEQEVGSDPTTTLHKWLGIAAGGASLLTAVLATIIGTSAAGSRAAQPATPKSGAGEAGTGSSNRSRPGPATTAYRLALFTTVAVLLPAGHLGGTITHGEGYLLAPLFRTTPDPEPQPLVDPQPTGENDPAVLGVAAREVLAARCVACHGPTRSRGGIRLDSMAALLIPGDDGTPIAPGDPAASTILQRMRRPLDARGHMPPPDREQPTPTEIAAVEAWIVALGQTQPAPSPAAPEPAGQVAPAPIVDTRASEPNSDVNPPEPPTPDAGAIGALRDRLVHVQPVATGSNLLWIDLSSLPGVPDTTVAQLLLPLKDNVAELSLARTGVTDSSLALAADMAWLTRLDLTGTSITDAGLARLAGHERLHTLVLVGTPVTDSAAPILATMSALRRVFVWRTGLTDEAVNWLALVRPDLTVDTGQAGDEPIEVEPVPVIPG